MSVDIKLNIPYSKYHPGRRIMDVFIPDKKNGCAMFFIHGGGWHSGEKVSWHPVARYFADRGFVSASMEYRLSGAAPHPAQIEDVRLGMSYFRRGAESFGFAPERIAVVGSSAGGHLAALLSTIDSDSPMGKTPELEYLHTRPNAAVLYCPVTTLCRYDEIEIIPAAIQKLMNNQNEQVAPVAYRSASPLECVTGKEPPFLFLHGGADETVPLCHSEGMAERLGNAGVYAELHVLPNTGHGFGYGVETDAQKKAIGHIEIFLKQIWKENYL